MGGGPEVSLRRPSPSLFLEDPPLGMLHLHWMRCPRVFPAAPSIGRVNTTWISLSFPPPPPPSPPSASYLPPSHGVTAPGADVGWKNNSSPAVGDGGWGAGEGPTRGRGIQRELEGLVGVGRCSPPRESEGWGGMRTCSRWGHEWESRGWHRSCSAIWWRLESAGTRGQRGGIWGGGIRGRGSTMGIRGHGDMGTRGIRGHGDKGAPAVRGHGEYGDRGTRGLGDIGTWRQGDTGTRRKGDHFGVRGQGAMGTWRQGDTAEVRGQGGVGTRAWRQTFPSPMGAPWGVDGPPEGSEGRGQVRSGRGHAQRGGEGEWLEGGGVVEAA